MSCGWFVRLQSPLGQPRNLVGGHLVSAFIGVACAQAVPSVWVASALAVALAVVAMEFLGVTHPPGGATALIAGAPVLILP